MTKKQFYDYWFKDEKPYLPMINLGRKLKCRSIKMFILSNNFRERAAYYRKNFSFINTLFIKVYYSWQTGYVKPDSRAYKKILIENNIEPNECLYFDDSKHNISVAKKIGIQAYIFSSVSDTARVLKKLSLL